MQYMLYLLEQQTVKAHQLLLFWLMTTMMWWKACPPSLARWQQLGSQLLLLSEKLVS